MTAWPRPTPHSFEPDEFGYCGVCGFGSDMAFHNEPLDESLRLEQERLENEARMFAAYEASENARIAAMPKWTETRRPTISGNR